MSGIRICLGVCDRKVSKNPTGRDLGGRSGSGHWDSSSIPRPQGKRSCKLQLAQQSSKLEELYKAQF